MKFFGTEQDCRNVRDCLDYADGYPFWPGAPAPITPEQEAKRQVWLGADLAGKTLLEASGQYNGWSLHREEVYPVDPPGFGWQTTVPDDVMTVVVPSALNVHNRTISVARLQVLTSAAAVLQEALPVQWEPLV